MQIAPSKLERTFPNGKAEETERKTSASIGPKSSYYHLGHRLLLLTG